MLVDRENLPRHLPWIIVAAGTTLCATIWFLFEVISGGGRPSGSSVPGFVFGLVAALIILFEFLLWPRKWLRTWRVGKTQAWMRAHIWLGLLSLPLAVYHSGFRFGGTLSSVLMVLFLMVIASGIIGLILQQILPSKLLVEVRAETVYSQIDHVLAQLRQEADQIVEAITGRSVTDDGHHGDILIGSHGDRAPLVVSSIGHVGGVQGRILHTVVPTHSMSGSEEIHEFYGNMVRPFLDVLASPGSPLHSAERAAVLFRDLRSKLDANALPAAEALENLCEQRRQLDKQAKIHFWLHSWLWVHLPLSAAMLFLLIVHICVAIRYW